MQLQLQEKQESKQPAEHKIKYTFASHAPHFLLTYLMRARVLIVAYSEGDTSLSRELVQSGKATRRQVLGDAFVENAAKSVNSFTREYDDFITENLWGRTWSRGVLSRYELSLVNLSMLMALGHKEQFEIHFRIALKRHNVPPLVLRELLFHITIHCGAPVGRQAFTIAEKVLIEEGFDPAAIKEYSEIEASGQS